MYIYIYIYIIDKILYIDKSLRFLPLTRGSSVAGFGGVLSARAGGAGLWGGHAGRPLEDTVLPP